MDHTDVAYAVLGYGESLPKMSHLEAQLPSLSIPVDGQRYAIATLDDGCEIFPLAFSAPEGRYTLGTQTSSSATIGYLHLIDKVAGEDIDLLRYPTYTFTVASGQWSVAGGRFLVKLSPTASIPHEEETFARWNGEAWVIDGDGTLQVYDVLGRCLFIKELSAFTSHLSPSTFPAAGVYVLRLGEKSQKIVVVK